MKIDFQEKIDDYVLGKMSAEDRGVFEKKVSQDKEMREQLELTLNVRDAIKSRQEKLAMMQKWENKSTGSDRKIMAWASSAIGVAAVFAIGFFLFVPKGNEKDLLTSIEVKFDKRNVKSIEKGMVKTESLENYIILRQVERKVKEEEYEDAITLINEIQISLNDKRKMLDDSIFIKLGITKELDNSDWELTNIDDFLYELRWLQIEAYVGLNEMEKAMMLLDKFCKEEGKFKSQADSLLNSIDLK